jgi:hypothetical protein
LRCVLFPAHENNILRGSTNVAPRYPSLVVTQYSIILLIIIIISRLYYNIFYDTGYLDITLPVWDNILQLAYYQHV